MGDPKWVLRGAWHVKGGSMETDSYIVPKSGFVPLSVTSSGLDTPHVRHSTACACLIFSEQIDRRREATDNLVEDREMRSGIKQRQEKLR